MGKDFLYPECCMPTLCQTLKPTSEALDFCAALLREGKIVGIPTETVYGLAGNALSEKSVRQIFTVKGRPLIDPLIVHFATPAATLEQIEAPEALSALATRFWPGPMTLVVKKKRSLPDLVTASHPSVAIRVPAHQVFQSLLKRVDFPLAAPSANPFGYVSPTEANHVRNTLGAHIPAVLDGGESQHGIESTIIDLRDEKTPSILRPGPITKEAIEACLNRKVQEPEKSELELAGSAPAAPGMLSQHYSTHAKVSLAKDDQELARQRKNQGTARIYQCKPEAVADKDDYWLSEDGDLKKIAHHLFALMQRLDAMGYSQIHIAKAPDSGIGKAINDRLTRAAGL